MDRNEIIHIPIHFAFLFFGCTTWHQSQPGAEPVPPAVKCGVFTTEPAGESPVVIINIPIFKVEEMKR